MKIGIYGGTFNPPHLGHFSAGSGAMAALGLDKLILVPADVPPHKVLPEDTPPAADRLEMARKMADALGERAEVSTIEFDREGADYTSDTLATLRAQYPQDELWLLMGTDMFLTLHLWHEPGKILDLAGVCAFGRSEKDGEEVFAPQRENLKRRFPQARLATITLPELVDISSTRLRALLADGEGGKYLVPAVYGYILMNRLYGTHADLAHLALPELRACSYSMIQQKRVPHIMGVEEEAVKLAQRWGADPEQARRAGILHDCTKYWTLEEHLALCDQYGVALDDLERRNVKLLHSKTGAAMAKHVFGQEDAVCQAIFWHTTGKANMDLLSKILYVADYMEPSRKPFEGLEEMRRLAYEDLDAAMLLGCELTIRDMEARGMEIHTNTRQAWTYLKG